jgi:hypothetical protein
MVSDLDIELQNNDIDPRYAIVGFATTKISPRHGRFEYDPFFINYAHTHYIGGINCYDSVGGTEWVTSADMAALEEHFGSSGVDDQFITEDLVGSADIYEAIEFTLNRSDYVWRPGAVKAFICVSDTCRETEGTEFDSIPPTHTNMSPWTKSEMIDLLRNNNVLAAWVVNQELRDVDTSQVLGANFDLVSYIPDGFGGYTTGTWDFSALDQGRKNSTNDSRCNVVGSYLDIKPAYTELASSTNGSVWDLYYLSQTNPDFVDNAASFSAAFVTLFAEEINQWECTSVSIPSIPFYCPSTDDSVDSVIKFTQTNVPDYYDEYGVPQGDDLNLHFRVTFYSDVNKSRVVYSSFSLIDNKRWYIKGLTYNALNDNGLTLEPEESVEVIYVPDVYPQQMYEKQSSIGGDVSLLSGVKYYVDIDIYNIDEMSLSSFSSIEFLVNASDVETGFWRENLDKNNWICSSQGQSDLLVSNSGEQTTFPSIASNMFDLFRIAYQNLINGETVITRAIWNSSIDKLYSSGQGGSETEGPSAGYRPKVITDQGQSFYIVSDDESKFYSYNCSLPEIDQVILDPSVVEEEEDEILCFPGTTLTTSEDFNIRVKESDTTGSFVINRDDPVSVVEKTNINLDISGIYGAYAVKIRNQNGYWSDWISLNSSNFISNDRFYVPWTLPRSNGIRHLCCQILTVYGQTAIKCIDIFVNMKTVDYFVEYYYDTDFQEKVPSREGFSLLATKNKSSALIYVKVTFSEPQTYSTLKFDVVHQGVSDIFNETLVPSTSETSPYTTYTGSFRIRREDNSVVDNCVSDKRDWYNQMLITSELEFLETVSQTPEEAFAEVSTRDVNKVLDVNDFKQYYNIDDVNFLFGDPGFYRN